MRTALVILISAIYFFGNSHGYKIVRRNRRSTSTYVADENGQRIVIMTSSSSPGLNSGLSSTNFGPNNFGPIKGIGSNRPLGSTSNLGSSIGGSIQGDRGGTLGSGGDILGGSIGLGNTGLKNYGNRDRGISKYPSARLIIEVLRLLGVPNLPPPLPLPSFPLAGGGIGGGEGGGTPGEGFNDALACSLLGRCAKEMDE